MENPEDKNRLLSPTTLSLTALLRPLVLSKSIKLMSEALSLLTIVTTPYLVPVAQGPARWQGVGGSGHHAEDVDARHAK